MYKFCVCMCVERKTDVHFHDRIDCCFATMYEKKNKHKLREKDRCEPQGDVIKQFFTFILEVLSATFFYCLRMR